MNHFHKCGFTGSPGGTGKGCGFIYQHNESCWGMNDAHTCPICGEKSLIYINGEAYTVKYDRANCLKAGEVYEDPDPKTCTVWPPASSDHPERPACADSPYSGIYKELISLDKCALLRVVRILGGDRSIRLDS